jgi:hypothetical protein
MQGLEHNHGDCTGNWRLVGASEARVIVCDICQAEYTASPENRLAAIDENYAGIYLRRLTAEGMANLGIDKPPTA